MSYFDDDIELVDVLRTAVISGDLTDPTTKYLMRHVDPARHSHIRRRRNADGSRENTINHLRQSVYTSYLKDMYEEVTEYLRLILEQAARNGLSAGRVVGEHTFKMDAKAILELGSWDNVCKSLAESIFQNLESERNTLNLLRKIPNKLGLDIPDNLIGDALPYLEIRHALVHTDGRLSPDFVAKYPVIPRKSNGCVNLSFTLINEARAKITALMEAYDAEVVEKNLLSEDDLQP
ncbi:hypothetical protein [Rhodocaloribacter sp.]